MELLSKIADKIAVFANAAGTLVVLALVLVVNYDIVARGVFNLPFRGAIEVVQFSMVLIVFLQLPDVVRVGRLTRSDGLLTLLGPRYPRVAHTLRRIINLLSAIIMALITVAIFPEFTEMWETRDFFGIPGVFTAPWWPIKLTILCSAALCTLIFLFKVLKKRQQKTPQNSENTPQETVS
ncbi:MAG: TRAP transporter small permease subunit [Thiolinea sp.]